MITIKEGQDPNTPTNELIYVQTTVTEVEPKTDTIEFSEQSLLTMIENIDTAIAEFAQRNNTEKAMYIELLTQIQSL